ncbi:MAG: hypothetical protein HC771_02035 [Synechococcales cyanobacterium CRU_2_2]|nr:hypothetical protein [Synechococcales cyanobacterium CRU_2_2]
MAPAPDRTLSIQITTSATNPALLTGLQTLLRLELISDRQIKQIASQHLQCRLPIQYWSLCQQILGQNSSRIHWQADG